MYICDPLTCSETTLFGINKHYSCNSDNDCLLYNVILFMEVEPYIFAIS